ncbi:MAG: Fe-S cluster biogenesis protein NfuA [Kiritimatiellia bacterium]|jgi:Fe-S cluster biogenesis protein NfuA
MNETQDTQDTIVIEPTAHPRAFKFIFPFNLKTEGTVSFAREEQCRHIPMAAALISLTGVAEIYFSENVLVVTRSREVEWDALEPQIQEVIQAQINGHDPEMPLAAKPGDTAKKVIRADGTDVGADEMIVIDNVLTQTIRPYIHSHGGEVELLAFDPESRELLLSYHGTCGNCSSSTAGTLQLIQEILREEYDPKIKVQAA